MAQGVNRLRKYKFTGIVGIAEIGVVTSLNVILRLRVMCFQSPKQTSSWCVVVLRGFTGKV